MGADSGTLVFHQVLPFIPPEASFSIFLPLPDDPVIGSNVLIEGPPCWFDAPRLPPPSSTAVLGGASFVPAANHVGFSTSSRFLFLGCPFSMAREWVYRRQAPDPFFFSLPLEEDLILTFSPTGEPLPIRKLIRKNMKFHGRTSWLPFFPLNAASVSPSLPNP